MEKERKFQEFYLEWLWKPVTTCERLLCEYLALIPTEQYARKMKWSQDS